MEEGDIAGATECAKTLTDTTYTDNLIRKTKRKNRPDGHSFEALERLADSHKDNDPYYIFSIEEDGDDVICHVMKSSRDNVNLLY